MATTAIKSFCYPNTRDQNNMNGEISANTVKSCKFCHASVANGFRIVYEDDAFVAFEDRKPASLHHFLVIPRKHIVSVKSLEASDAPLVKRMEEIGNVILDELNVSADMRRMGFHIPPFNSVYHLHLHVQGLPYLSSVRAAKYPLAIGTNGNMKGLSWFVTAQQAIQVLERGHRVGVLPC